MTPRQRAREPAVRHRRNDRGVATVEFVLVSTLVLAVFLGVVQLGFALYVRNTLVASAADGARYAANADRAPADGAARTRELIRRALPDSFARDVRAGVDPATGTVFVEVRAGVPLVGPWGPPRSLVLRGHALEEGGGG